MGLGLYRAGHAAQEDVGGETLADDGGLGGAPLVRVPKAGLAHVARGLLLGVLNREKKGAGSALRTYVSCKSLVGTFPRTRGAVCVRSNKVTLPSYFTRGRTIMTSMLREREGEIPLPSLSLMDFRHSAMSSEIPFAPLHTFLGKGGLSRSLRTSQRSRHFYEQSFDIRSYVLTWTLKATQSGASVEKRLPQVKHLTLFSSLGRGNLGTEAEAAVVFLAAEEVEGFGVVVGIGQGCTLHVRDSSLDPRHLFPSPVAWRVMVRKRDWTPVLQERVQRLQGPNSDHLQSTKGG